ncbi:MAG: hypothetical protein LBV29_04545 [Azoarcus sp.]|jgi:hypothetical protein|nr:hypothetical protein [Azoarcus sp.]
MRRFAMGIVLSCLSAIAVAADPAAIARKLIGYEYTATRDPLPGLGDCVDEGGGSILNSDEFGFAIIRCGKNRLLALSTSKASRLPHYRILDAIVLPKFDRHYTSDNDKQLLPGGTTCELDGSLETDMQVLVRFGKRERVTSKNGVLAAWGYDLEKGKIIPLDISRITCEKPTPP